MRLAQKYGQIVELRDGSDSYHIYKSDTMKWEHKYLDESSQKFIEEELNLVNTHMKTKHRIFRVSKDELKVLDILDNYRFGPVYVAKGWAGIAERYIKTIELLRDPLSDVKLLKSLTNICWSNIPELLMAETLSTGKSWKESVVSLKNKSTLFAEQWNKIITQIQKHIDEMKLLLPYLTEYLPDKYKCSTSFCKK